MGSVRSKILRTVSKCTECGEDFEKFVANKSSKRTLLLMCDYCKSKAVSKYNREKYQSRKKAIA